MADGILLRDQCPKARQAYANLWAIHHTAQPGGVLVLEDVDEFIKPFLVEALRRHPHLRLGMIAMQTFSLLLKEGHQELWAGVAGVTARNQDRVNARQLFENLAPFL